MTGKKITVMVQARTGSTRFPRKTLALIEQKPMIWYVINRVKKIKFVDQVVLITSKKKEDKILLKIAEENEILGFAGDTNDLISRHYQCALKFNADPIIRITSDCPLVDPKLVGKMLQVFLKNDYDYLSNCVKRTFPDGLDVEIFSFCALKKAERFAKLSSEREHVSPYFTKNPKKFKLFDYLNNKDLSNLRLTVDYNKDLKLVKEIYHRMKPRTTFSLPAIVKIIKEEPRLLKINQGIEPNEGFLKSLKNDRRVK